MASSIGPLGWHGAGAAYLDAIRAHGGVPFIAPTTDVEDVLRLIGQSSGVVLTGGGDVNPRRYADTVHPAVYGVSDVRDAVECASVLYALEHSIPLLAICRGMHIANVAAGGSLTQHIDGHLDLDSPRKQRHRTSIRNGSLLSSLLANRTEMLVNSLHHQVIESAGKTVVAIAWSEESTIEAIQFEGRDDFLGVQWHPELLSDERDHASLFEWLVNRARDHDDSEAVCP